MGQMVHGGERGEPWARGAQGVMGGGGQLPQDGEDSRRAGSEDADMGEGVVGSGNSECKGKEASAAGGKGRGQRGSDPK